MGTALYLALTSGRGTIRQREDAESYFAAQLVLNFLWPLAFFRFETPWAAAVCLAFLILFVVLTISAFAGLDRTAALLLIPYLVWCVFALYLNLGICFLN